MAPSARRGAPGVMQVNAGGSVEVIRALWPCPKILRKNGR